MIFGGIEAPAKYESTTVFALEERDWFWLCLANFAFLSQINDFKTTFNFVVRHPNRISFEDGLIGDCSLTLSSYARLTQIDMESNAIDSFALLTDGMSMTICPVEWISFIHPSIQLWWAWWWWSGFNHGSSFLKSAHLKSLYLSLGIKFLKFNQDVLNLGHKLNLTVHTLNQIFKLWMIWRCVCIECEINVNPWTLASLTNIKLCI